MPNKQRVSGVSVRASAAVWNPPRHVTIARGARMAYRDCGDASSDKCWLLLHGGPGGSSQPGMLAPMQIERQRVLLPDQRGAGQSRPRARLAGNHTDQLVADLERLREELGIDRWALLAGSWGTVVALRYAQAHANRVERMVLRGAFGLKRAEISGLLRPHPQRDRAIFQNTAWPQANFAGHAQVLAKLEHMLQFRTLSVTSRRVIRSWNLLELRSALQGAWRSLIHAALAAPRILNRPAAVVCRPAWAMLRRQQRRALAGLNRRQTVRADQRGWQKFRIQAHYLRHKGFVPAGSLDAAVRSLAAAGIPVDWVHGRFDAVCLPGNSRRWLREQQAQPRNQSQGHWPLAGHLGTEPGMRETLAKVVRQDRSAR